MGKNAMVQCAVCGQEIAKSAAACPHCGAKNKKPIFKKWWFWAVIIVIVGIIGTATQGGDAQQPQTPVATPGTATSTAPSTPTPKPTSTPKPTPAPTPEETVNPNLIDGKFELIGEVTAEKDTFALYITGTLKNTTKKTYSYAQVTFNLYDADGNQIGTAFDNINNWEAGGTWKFKAMGMENEAASYKLVEVTAF